MMCYIFDIDGTLSNGDHRLHLIRPPVISEEGIRSNEELAEHMAKSKPNWDAYFMACGDDTPHEHICMLVRDLSEFAEIVYVTGRSDICRALTQKWLIRNALPSERLYMRKQGDHKNDDLLKIELLAQIRADGYEPIMAFDDRDRVVKAWRAAGIPCAQVAEGAF